MLGLLKIEENNQKSSLKNPVRCRNCFFWIEEDSDTCQYCGVFRNFAQPKTWLEKLKRFLGIEISSELIVLSIKAPDTFFTEVEIDSILDVQNFKVLELEDVPNWNLMFYSAKRVSKPGCRRIPVNRQIANNRPNPKLLGGSQNTIAAAGKRISRPTIRTRQQLFQ